MTHKLYVDLGPKRHLGPRDPIIGSIQDFKRIKYLNEKGHTKNYDLLLKNNKEKLSLFYYL